jgi:hypothetical protein
MESLIVDLLGYGSPMLQSTQASSLALLDGFVLIREFGERVPFLPSGPSTERIS